MEVMELADDDGRIVIRDEVFTIRVQVFPPHSRRPVRWSIQDEGTALVDGREVR